MDYGFAPPGTTPGSMTQSALLQSMFSRRVPPTRVRASGTTLQSFIEDLDTDSSVSKPIGDLIYGAHASSEGFIFQPLFAGQKDLADKPKMNSDYEIVASALTGPRRPIRIPDDLVGFTTPPPTHHLHVKGCNLGRDRTDVTRNPKAPYLTKLKEALGGHVGVTAPRHFHGVHVLDDGSGTFEYMAHEFVVRTQATPAEGGGFRGFANRAAVIAAFAGAGLHYDDTTPVPAADWPPLIPTTLSRTSRFDVSLPLGRTVAERTTLTVGREFRVEPAEVPWPVRIPGGVPTSVDGKLAALRADLAADPRFDAAHAWPAFERVGFTTFAKYFDGHHWTMTGTGTVMNCVGRRFDYTVVLPIVNRTVTPVRDRPVIFNFYPGPNTTQAAITTGFVETDDVYFGRA